MPHKILLVEDSPVLTRVLVRAIHNSEMFLVVHAMNYKEAQVILERESNDLFLALLDIVLPDSKDGEIVDLVRSYNVPVIVFTSLFSDDMRDLMESKEIVDYVIKKDNLNVDYVVALIHRVYKNSFIKALIVEDSRTIRMSIYKMLSSYKFQIFEAANGAEAINILKKEKDIRLVVTDYIMPEVDGFELLDWIRNSFKKSCSDLAVIGLSAHGSNRLSARFIKSGGNDFLNKPFLKEELLCRINQTIENIEHIETIRNLALTDPMTGLSNRRHFFETGEKLYVNAKRKNLNIALAMLDIDHFKHVNDTFGHYAGDLTIKKVSNLLKDAFRKSDIVARIGGEEFCVLAVNIKEDSITQTFERLRNKIETNEITFGKERFHITISIGVTMILSDSLEHMMRLADELLYKAKNSGRNCIICQ
ncbi:MAG: diguanylate cyclase [Nitrospirae bacterium]|nr:diguanylate cyclase [Nitrospirota bacterium]